MSDETGREAIRQQVRALRGFYAHVLTYVVVIGGLAILDGLMGPPWWVYWPAVGWGIIVVLHAFQLFVVERFFGQEWEERTIDRMAHRH